MRLNKLINFKIIDNTGFGMGTFGDFYLMKYLKKGYRIFMINDVQIDDIY